VADELPAVKPASKPFVRSTKREFRGRGGPEGYSADDLAQATKGPLVSERETSRQLSADYHRTKGRSRGRIALRGSQR
jgi:hypothetical protein